MKISPHGALRIMTTLLASFGSSLLGGLQDVVFKRRLAATEIEQGPLFILGHWRSGTTLLHELLCRDPRHTFPDQYCCSAPRHFLISGRIGRRLFRRLLPQDRIMDRMKVGFGRPQEDEFALCLLGVPSPYLRIALPNRDPFPEYADLETVKGADRQRWENELEKLLRKLTLRERKRIVLKGPLHTLRLPTLVRMFPSARFVYLRRSPESVIPSTLHLWRSLYSSQGLQTPRLDGLEDSVFEMYSRMRRRFLETRSLIPVGQLHSLRYEDLVEDPLGCLKELYESLHLGDFEPARSEVEHYLSQIKDYRPNRYRPSARLRKRIARLARE